MNNDDTITFADGRIFERLDAAASGDYSGYGSIGRSNIRVLKKEYSYEYHSYSDLFWYGVKYGEFPRVSVRKRDNDNLGLGYWEDENIILEPETVIVISTCAYDYEQVYMDTAHPDFENLKKSMEDYCVLDDCDHSDLQFDEWVETWNSWLERDVMSELRKLYEWDEETGDYSTEFEKFETTWDKNTEHQFDFFHRYINDQQCYFEEQGTSGFSVDIQRVNFDGFMEEFYEYLEAA